MIIYKTVIIKGKRWQYWSDDKGLSWYWIGARKPSRDRKQVRENKRQGF